MRAIEASEKIVCRFCNLHGGLEAAMPIITDQFSKVGADFSNPSKEELKVIVERLLELLSGCKPPFIVEKERKMWQRWINNISYT